MVLRSVIIVFMLVSLSGCTEKSQSGNVDQDTSLSNLTGNAKGSLSKGDGPFGLNLAANYSSLPLADPDKNPEGGGHLLTSVENSSDEFDTYAVEAFRDVGLCEIRAVSADITNDTLGNRAKSTTDNIAEAISAKYGKADKADVCIGDGTCEATNWTYAVGDGSRHYMYEWYKPAEKNIRDIKLMVMAKDVITTYIRLDYAVNDAQKCKKAEISSKSSNF